MRSMYGQTEYEDPNDYEDPACEECGGDTRVNDHAVTCSYHPDYACADAAYEQWRDRRFPEGE